MHWAIVDFVKLKHLSHTSFINFHYSVSQCRTNACPTWMEFNIIALSLKFKILITEENFKWKGIYLRFIKGMDAISTLQIPQLNGTIISTWNHLISVWRWPSATDPICVIIERSYKPKIAIFKMNVKMVYLNASNNTLHTWTYAHSTVL